MWPNRPLSVLNAASLPIFRIKNMRFLIKLRFFSSSSTTTSRRILRFCSSRYQLLCFSSYSRRPKHFQPKKLPVTLLENPPESTSFVSLFSEITEILGADGLISDRVSSGISSSNENHVVDKEMSEENYPHPPCTQSVCSNALMGNTAGDDVGPVVHRITKLVRDEDAVATMEERLSNSGFQFNSDIVDKVLKRCFKVPHLAFRLFNWVKTIEGFGHTTETYNTMLYIVGEAREFALMEDLVEEMERNSCEKDFKTWTILIMQYGKAKLIGKALFVFEKMRKYGCEPDETAYKMMINSLCTAGKADIAMEFYKEMASKDMVLDVRSYKWLLNCISVSSESADVHSVAEDMMSVLQISAHDVYGYLLKSFCISGRIREALELIRDLRDKELTIDVVYFEILVKGLCKADRIADALEIVDLMKKKNLVDGKVYGIIINGYLRSNKVAEALELFQSMKEEGYLPTTSTYTDLMQHLFRIHKYQEGCKLYNEMLESGIEPDIVAITAMVAGHVQQNHISEAWEMFKSVVDRGIKPTWKMCMVFVKELCKVARSDEVVKILEEIQASKIVNQDAMFQMVITYMEKKGDMHNLEKVKKMCGLYKVDPREVVSGGASSRLELNAKLDASHLEPVQTETRPAELLSKSYDQQDLQDICRILSSSMNWCSMQEALEKCRLQFTPDLVEEVFKKCSMHGHALLHFFSWVRKQAGYSHTTETYNAAIKIAGGGKDFRQMRNLFYEMKRNSYNITSDTWTIMIMQYGRTGLTEIALRIFKEMKANGYAPTGSTYKYLIISLCGRKGRNVDEAIKIFQEMIRDGHTPHKELLEIYLGCLCEMGKLSDAKKCLETLSKAGFTTPLSYSLLVRGLCRAGRLEEAFRLIDEVGSDRSTLDQYTYASVVHGLLRKGRLEEAMAKVESMKQGGVHPTVHVYTSLIVHFFKEKQLGRALETYENMQQEGCEPTIVTYSALIRGFMNMEKAGDAWRVFHDMKQKGCLPDFKMYSMFITCLCNAGKSEQALQLLSEMLESGIAPSSVNFQTVFFGLNREGKQDLARKVSQQKSALSRNRTLIQPL